MGRTALMRRMPESRVAPWPRTVVAQVRDPTAVAANGDGKTVGSREDLCSNFSSAT